MNYGLYIYIYVYPFKLRILLLAPGPQSRPKDKRADVQRRWLKNPATYPVSIMEVEYCEVFFCSPSRCPANVGATENGCSVRLTLLRQVQTHQHSSLYRH